MYKILILMNNHIILIISAVKLQFKQIKKMVFTLLLDELSRAKRH